MTTKKGREASEKRSSDAATARFNKAERERREFATGFNKRSILEAKSRFEEVKEW